MCWKLPFCEFIHFLQFREQIRCKKVPPRTPQPTLLLRCPFSPCPPFSGFVASVLLVQTALSIWPYAFSPFVQRPETIPRRVVGGLYTGNVAASLHLCFLKTHVNFRWKTGKSGLAGWNPYYFPGDALIYIWVLAFGPRVTWVPFCIQGRDFPTQSLIVALGISGRIPRSDVPFLTLEMSTLGFRALTCLTFMGKNTFSLF